MNWYKQAQLQDQEVYKLVGVVKFVVEHWKTVKSLPEPNLESMVYALNTLESHVAQYDQHAARKMQEANDAVKNWQFSNPVNPPSKNIEPQQPTTPPPAPMQ